MQSSYETFKELLPTALLAGEIGHPKAYKLLGAIERIRRIEFGPDGQGGQTGFLRDIDPIQALREYVAFIYDGGQIPSWLASAERG